MPVISVLLQKVLGGDKGPPPKEETDSVFDSFGDAKKDTFGKGLVDSTSPALSVNQAGAHMDPLGQAARKSKQFFGGF